MLKLEKKFRNRVTGEVFSDFLDVIGDRVTLNYSFRYCSSGYRGECGKIAKKNALQHRLFGSRNSSQATTLSPRGRYITRQKSRGWAAMVKLDFCFPY